MNSQWVLVSPANCLSNEELSLLLIFLSLVAYITLILIFLKSSHILVCFLLRPHLNQTRVFLFVCFPPKTILVGNKPHWKGFLKLFQMAP